MRLNFLSIFLLLFLFTGDASAASLGVSVLGAAVGSFFGAPQLGWMIGSFIGNYFFGPKPKDVIGPRLDSLKVTSSAYGVTIPKIFGTIRVSGNIIWATDIVEQRNEEEIRQGKGSRKKPKNVTYQYFGNFAVALCEGPISDVRKMWIDGKLFYDKGEGNLIKTNDLKYDDMVIYPGDEDQLPDPFIEGFEGIGEVNANRGLAYVVFNRLDLTDFGSRIPNITFEIIKKINDEDTDKPVLLSERIDGSFNEATTSKKMISKLYDEVTDSFFGLSYRLDTDITNGNYNILNKFDIDGNLIKRIDLGTVKGSNPSSGEYRIHALKDSPILFIHHSNSYSFFTVDKQNLVVKDRTTLGDFVQNTKRDELEALLGLSFRVTETNTHGNITHSINYIKGQYVIACSPIALSGKMLFLHINSTFSAINNYFLLDSDKTIFSLNFSAAGNLCFDSAIDETNTCFYFVSLSDGGHMFCSKYNYNNNTLDDGAFNLEDAGGVINGAIYSIYFDPVKRNLYYRNLNYLHRINVDDNNDWQQLSSLTPAWSVPQTTSIYGQMVQDSRYLFSNVVGNNIIKYDMDSYTTVEEQIFKDDPLTINDDSKQYIPLLNCYMFGYSDGNITTEFPTHNFTYSDAYLLLNFGIRATKVSQSLKEIVDDVCLSTGLLPEQIDTDDLASTMVRGYMIPTRTTARSVLEQLGTVFLFDVIESGYILKFVMRGNTPSKNINLIDTGAQFYSENPNFADNLKITRMQELELPESFEITYLDVNKDYNHNTQRSTRDSLDTTKEKGNLEVPLVFTANEAKRISDRILNIAWMGRDTFSFELNKDYLELEPTDVVTINKYITYNLRLVKKEEDRGIIKFEGIVEDLEPLIQDDSEGDTGDVIDQEINFNSKSDFIPMDIPLLTEQSEGAGFYVGIVRLSNSGEWDGASILKLDNNSYSEVASSSIQVIHGSTENKLDNFTGGNILDTSNTVNVNLINGELSSCTYTEMLNGSNLCLIGQELLQFQTATLVEPGIYTLSNLLRGRFATEDYINTHVDGEQFVFFNTNIKKVSLPTSDLDKTVRYETITFGDDDDRTTIRDFACSMVILKPPKVVHVISTRDTSGNITCSFTKRVRGQQYLINGSDVLDLDGDNYTVEIYSNSSYSTIKRTYGLLTTSFIYSSADQILDFGSNQSTVYCKIYKNNNLIGKGFAWTGTI